MTDAAMEERLAALLHMDGDALRARWTELTGKPPPRVRPAILRFAVGYEMQAREYGGLSRTTQQRLTQVLVGKTKTSTAAPGMRLLREWNGVVHVVTIGEDGIIRWSDRDWRSLSEVARAITGTRWSGPAFFGLKRKLAA